MDPKLAILFMLIGTIVGLSRLSEVPRAERVQRVRRALVWRRS